MAKVTTYDNSKFATFLSILGYFAIVLGAYCCFNDELGIAPGVILLLAGFGLKLLASFISKKKREKAAKQNQNV